MATKKTSGPSPSDSPRNRTAAKLGKACFCGCGQLASPGKRFKMGHDGKLHGMVKRLFEDEELRAYVRERGWLNDEQEKALGLRS